MQIKGEEMVGTLAFITLWAIGIMENPQANDMNMWIFTAICLYGILHN